MTEDKDLNSTLKIVAPARICLFGDHQDYLGLPVIACAINRQITLIAKPNKSLEFIFNLPDIQSQRSFSIHTSFAMLEPGDFFGSALRRVRKYGCIPTLGYSITIQGNIPVNAGVSSSSALVVAWVLFLLDTFGCDREITAEFISQLAYEAEVLEHNSPGGKMDQYSIGIGNIIFMETGNHFSYQILGNKMDGLILGESGIVKDTLGVLSSAKTNAIEAIKVIQNKRPEFTIETATLRDYEISSHLLSETLKPYFYAAIQNHRITQKARAELRKEPVNLQKIGALMNEHHTMLRDHLKITVPRIDAMIEAAKAAGAYGAKIVGSGGGGCIVAVSPKDKKKEIIEAIKQAGAKDAYEVLVAKGVFKL
jgi:galactokinase